MRTSSRASRKKICGRIPRPSSAPRIAASAIAASPARTSRTIATREKRWRSDETSSASSGSSSPGRLSTTVYSRSSNSFAAAVFPPPDSPVRMTTCWSPIAPASGALASPETPAPGSVAS
jgi:hypothetical protein